MSGPTLGPRFADALAYAADAHREQRRKGGPIPYVAHLLAVCALVIEDAARSGALTEDLAIAALLHDVAEDHGGEPRLADVRERFGPEVARIVEACSDSLTEDAAARPPWRERKEAYLAGLEHHDESVLRVSLADKLHNARAIVADYAEVGDTLWERFSPETDSVWYLHSVAVIIGRRLPGRQAGELMALVRELAERTGRTLPA